MGGTNGCPGVGNGVVPGCASSGVATGAGAGPRSEVGATGRESIATVIKDDSVYLVRVYAA